MNIQAFIDDLNRRKPRTPEMLRTYCSTLRRFEAFLRERGLKVTQVRKPTVDAFIDHLSAQPTRKKGPKLAPASVARNLAILSSFYDHLRAKTDGRITNPIKEVVRPEVNNTLIRALDDATADHLLDSIGHKRDKALLMLFIASGLRLHEVHQIDKDTIRRRSKTLPDGTNLTIGFGTVVGKGGKPRRFIVDENALEALKAYLRERGRDQNPALFTSERNTRLSTRSMQSILQRRCRSLGLSHIHIHQLRHTFATRMANAGMPSLVLQELMGHKSFTTTRRYFGLSDDRLAREYFAAWEFINR
ncbi:MAG TPA: tyrosine-type recombinase/integrase [Candidatus Nanoarchaeia archaeon]|nr:tyrosine-type recombinase/integrase [Candidatus Nanoarchaeia archaeon]